MYNPFEVQKIMAQVDACLVDDERNITWMARQAGLDSSTVRTWRHGTAPSVTNWQKFLCAAINLGYLDDLPWRPEGADK